MAFVLKDRVLETTTTTGTGTIALGGAATGGFRTFASVMATSDTTYYVIQDTTNSAWEVGLGTLTSASVLTRTTVIASSNANAAVSFAAGTKQVFMSYPGDRNLVLQDDMSAQFQDIVTEPAAPATGLKLYSKNIAGRRILKTIGPSGLDMALQNSLWANTQTIWTPTNATAGNGQTTAFTTAGTYTSLLPTTTNLWTSTKRAQYANVVTTANQILGVRAVESYFYRSSSAGQGGFFMFCRFGFGTWTAGGRLFVGMSSVTSGATVSSNPSASTNIAGFGIDAGDTAITFMTNANSTTTKTAISGQPALASNQGYDAYIFVPPNSSLIYYRLVNVNTNAEIVNTSISTNLPVANTMLAVQALASNAALTPVNSVQLAINRIYVETDY